MQKLGIHIRNNFEEILEKWIEMNIEEKDDRLLHLMSDQVVNETLREFAELMVSNLIESEADYEDRLADLSEKVVRFGWSITSVVKIINHFAQIVYQVLDEHNLIQTDNIHDYMGIFSKWITPMSEGIISAYSETWERTVSLQKIALQELSASLIPVFDKISVMPLVGTIDTDRAKLIMENLLEGIVQHRAEVVLLDITGVPLVDTMVAHHLIQASDAVRLIGAKCIIVGIRPEIAQTIVTLGINLSEIYTSSTLQRGVEQALEWTNRKIVEVKSIERTYTNS